MNSVRYGLAKKILFNKMNNKNAIPPIKPNMLNDVSKTQAFSFSYKLPVVNYYHKALHLGCCSSPRSASE